MKCKSYPLSDRSVSVHVDQHQHYQNSWFPWHVVFQKWFYPLQCDLTWIFAIRKKAIVEHGFFERRFFSTLRRGMFCKTVNTDSIVMPRVAVSMEALTTIALHYLIKIPVLLDNNFWGGRGAEREPQQGTRNAILMSYHHSRYVLHTVTTFVGRRDT